MDQQEPEERSLVKYKRMNQKCGQKKMVFGGPKEKEGKKGFGFSKGTEGLRKGGFRTGPSGKGFKQ